MALLYIRHREKQYLNKHGACGSWEKETGEERRVVRKYIVEEKTVKNPCYTEDHGWIIQSDSNKWISEIWNFTWLCSWIK